MLKLRSFALHFPFALVCALVWGLVWTAFFSGSAVYAGALPPTTTVLTITPGTTLAVGTAVTLTAAVTAGGKPVTPGLVLFCNAAAAHCTDINILGQGQLVGGTATVVLRLGIGSHSVKAVFQGTNANAASSSSTQQLMVTGKETTLMTLGVSGRTYATQVVSHGKTPVTGDVLFKDVLNQQTPFAAASLGQSTETLSFSTIAQHSIGPGPDTIITADFNQDGLPDVAIADEEEGAVRVFINAGNGAFTQIVLPQNTANGLAFGDFNEDGHPDIVVSNSTLLGGQLTILFGDGKGGFPTSAAVSLRNGPGNLAVGDFNGDGHADLAVLYFGNGSPQRQLGILLGDGTGVFSLAQGSPIPAGVQPGSLTVGDFNRDGKLDVAVTDAGDGANYFGGITVLLGDGTGFLNATSQSPIQLGNQPTSIGTADLNGDGILDLVAGGYGVLPLLGDGTGLFTQGFFWYRGVETNSLVLGDFNGDGYVDAATEALDLGGIAVLKGDGKGGLLPFPGFPVPSTAYFLGASDFTGDGQLDLAGVQLPIPPAFVGSLLILQNNLTQTAFATATNVIVPGGGTRHIFSSKTGDETHIGTTSPTTWSVPGDPVATATGLSVSPGATVPPGTTVQLTATISPAKSAGYTASGTVNFYDGNLMIGAGSLSNEQAVFSTNAFKAGTHQLTAVYSGDSNFSGSTSPLTVLTVQ